MSAQAPKNKPVDTRRSKVVLPTFMEVLDSSIVSVRCPTLPGASPYRVRKATWVQTSYLISNAVVLPAERRGSRHSFGRNLFPGVHCIFTPPRSCAVSRLRWAFSAGSRAAKVIGGGALGSAFAGPFCWKISPKKTRSGDGGPGHGGCGCARVRTTAGGWITENYSWPCCLHKCASRLGGPCG